LIFYARRGRDVPMPFGPYLAITGLFMLPFGQVIAQKYLGILL